MARIALYRLHHVAARATVLFTLCAVALGATACGTTYIGSTEIPDTEENRAIYERVMEYRQAIEDRDADKLRGMASRDYYENANTTDRSDDDYGHDFLTTTVMSELADNILDVNLRILMRRIEVDGDRATADYEYYYQYKYTEAGVTGWEQKNDFNRLEFVHEDGAWKIMGGL